MLSPEFAQLLAMTLAGIAVGGVVYVLVIPYVSGERKASQRVGNVAQGVPSRTAVPRSLQIRKRKVQESIKNIEAKQNPKKLVPVRIRLIRAGLSMKPRGYYLLSCLTGLLGVSSCLSQALRRSSHCWLLSPAGSACRAGSSGA